MRLTQATPTCSRPRSHVAPSRPKILLIESHPGLRSRMAESLEARGCHVIAAQSGVRGLFQFCLDGPDLVILDAELPDMNGLQVLREIRERSEAVPMILLTPMVAPIHSAIRSVVVLRKPFLPAQLLERVRELLGATLAAASRHRASDEREGPDLLARCS